jgi:hypothetical protein
MTPRGLPGIRSVATHELGTILASRRWRRVRGWWICALALFVVMLRVIVGPHAAQDDVEPGITVFGGLILVMLALLLLAIPGLAAPLLRSRPLADMTSERGGPSPIAVALGQLAALWLAALLLLVSAAPVVLVTLPMGGVGWRRALVALALIAAMAGVCAALVLCAAGPRRPLRNGYLAVAVLVFGPLVAFALGLAATEGEHRYIERERAFDKELRPIGINSISRTKHGVNSAQVWWLMSPTPFAVLGDAMPRARPRIDPDTNAFWLIQYDPLAVVRDVVRDARTTGSEFDAFDPYLLLGRTVDRYIEPPASWPVGLAADVALGAGAVLLRVRRLQTRAPDLVS